MLTRININLAQSSGGAGINVRLLQVVKADEYKC